jgi:hypothetical protein
MVREIRGAKINPKSAFKNWGAQNTQGRKLRYIYIYFGGGGRGLGGGNLYEHTNLQCVVKMFLDRGNSCNIRLTGKDSTFLLEATDITPFYLFVTALV